MDFHLDLNTETVKRIYAPDPIYLPPSATVREALRQMKERNTGSVLVTRDGVLIGIFTERDALEMMAQRADFDVALEERMADHPVCLGEDDTVGQAIAKMSCGGLRHLPIVDQEGHSKGVLKTRAILRYLVEHFPKVVYTLPPRPHHTTQHREGA